jgi:voltage-gated potassium channel
MLRRSLELMGLAGVSPAENERARLWQKRLHVPMMAVAMLALALSYLSIVQGDPFVAAHEMAIAVILALLFATELLFFLSIVDSPGRFLAHNWLVALAALSLLAGLMVPDDQSWVAFVRLLRLVVAGAITLQAAGGLRDLSPRSAPMLLLIAAVLLVFCGAAFYAIDPGIHSLGDGMWLSFVTSTTVGYGDLVPGTTVARLFAVITVMLGASMMALVTATITAKFLDGEEARQRREARAQLREIRAELAALTLEVRRLADREPPEPAQDPGP